MDDLEPTVSDDVQPELGALRVRLEHRMARRQAAIDDLLFREIDPGPLFDSDDLLMMQAAIDLCTLAPLLARVATNVQPRAGGDVEQLLRTWAQMCRRMKESA